MGRRLRLLTEGVEELKEELSELQVGDIFTFGDYHGEIEWKVLDKTSDSLLVISEYALDAKPFDKNRKTNEWDSCSLKRWLNSTFFNKAFSSEEKSLIENTSFGKVFLLSIEEVKRYFSSKSDRQCKPTQYAKSQKVILWQGFAWWWLRSCCNYSDDYVANVNADGYLDNRAFDASGYVRPAMKLKI